jgi:methyl-accepting chemotaxis protein
VDQNGVVKRAIAALLGVDVLFCTIIPFAFAATLGGPLWKVVAIQGGLHVVRLVIDAAYLFGALAPVDRWAGAVPTRRTDAMTRAAALALQRIPLRYSLLFGGGFALAFLSTALVLVYVLHDPSVSEQLVVQVSVATGAIIMGGATVAFPLVEALLSNVLADVMADVARRGVDAPAATTATQRRIAVLAMGLALSPVPWFAGIGYRAGNEDTRDIALEQARTASLEAALSQDSGRAQGSPANASVRVLDASDTDPCVAQARTEAVAGAAAFVDIPAERAIACRRLRDGRYAVATVAVSSDRSLHSLLISASFLGVLAVWAPLSAFFFGRSIALPIVRLADATRRISEIGDIGVMGTIPVSYDDELGALTRNFNTLLEDMRTLSAAATAVAAGDLTVAATSRGDLADAFRGMLGSLRDVVHQIRETSVQVASASAEIYSASQEQEAAASQQSAGMVEVSRTMESLSGSAAHIADSVRGVLSDAERTRENTDQMTARIAELNGHAQRIGELLEVIRDVADRSDLLALNGSLEATRSGEAGKGFSLIAGEMRRLAERVTATVDNVRQLLADIRSSGSSAVMATEQSRKVAESTTDAARRITLVVQQQRSATDAVSASVRDVTTVVGQAAIATTQTRVSAEELKKQADRLERLLRRFVVQAPV